MAAISETELLGVNNTMYMYKVGDHEFGIGNAPAAAKWTIQSRFSAKSHLRVNDLDPEFL